MKSKILSILVIFSLMVIGTGTTSAYPCTVDVSGIWTSVDGGSNVNGVGTNEVRWGNPADTYQSGLRFDGATSQNCDFGNEFLLGDFTHFNYPVTNSASGATLEIALDFLNLPDTTFTYDFAIEETPNIPGSCPSWQQSGTPCDDRITFPSAYGSESFVVGDTTCTLEIVGFVNSYPGGTPVNAFITEEGMSNTAYLVGQIKCVPVADAGPDQTVEQTYYQGADVTLDGSGSYDLDGDSLTYNWTWAGGSATGVNPTASFPLGTTTVTLEVDDGVNTDTDTVDITVEDTTPPEISVSQPEAIELWPVNHKYHTIEIIDDCGISVTDICDAGLSTDDVVITSVSSDEPENIVPDGGDGDTINDIVIVDSQTVDLRAERIGTGGNGRVYTINFEVTDDSGNTATANCKVAASPHDKGPMGGAVDDGAAAGYTVYYP